MAMRVVKCCLLDEMRQSRIQDLGLEARDFDKGSKCRRPWLGVGFYVSTYQKTPAENQVNRDPTLMRMKFSAITMAMIVIIDTSM